MKKPSKPLPFNPPGMSWYSLQFLRPLAEWYVYMSKDQREQLPPRVANALDSVKEIMSVKDGGGDGDC